MECGVKVEWPRGKAKDEDDGCPRKAWLKRDKTVLWRLRSQDRAAGGPCRVTEGMCRESGVATGPNQEGLVEVGGVAKTGPCDSDPCPLSAERGLRGGRSPLSLVLPVLMGHCPVQGSYQTEYRGESILYRVVGTDTKFKGHFSKA
ncbi:hypothetical protein J6590_007390 [Homalodisca vitripennis]|nr:hypothetical protein J6590_007390 [Homalodisca vitripennis]